MPGYSFPIKKGKADVSAQTVSKWIVKVVKNAYETSNEESTRRREIKAHGVRAFSSA